jgi:hypothetical protein
MKESVRKILSSLILIIFAIAIVSISSIDEMEQRNRLRIWNEEIISWKSPKYEKEKREQQKKLRRRQDLQKIIDELDYIRSEQTNLCFAVVSRGRLTNVPCTDEVMEKINKPAN